ncbi:hypothetical protein V1514DRAFT_331258 [Lipomyces japonicus]|uniref:uncharacterized protein n=1 Tax=Lipomyces japonicus TaxID=56871 RepID=UPI0034CEFEF0
MPSVKVHTYNSFLQRPDRSQFSDSSSPSRLTYVTSNHIFFGVDAILENAILNNRQIKKSDKVISTHVAADSLVLETITTIEFVDGTGSYVPGLDKNFIVDHTVVLPIIHVVVFDDNDKIKSIRIFWDQATVLKQLNIIGSRGNIWPIVDGCESETTLLNDYIPSYDAPARSAQEPQPRHSTAAAAAIGPSNRAQDDEFAPEHAATPEQVRAKRDFNSKNFEPHWKFGTPDGKPEPYSKTRAHMHPQPGDLNWNYDNKGAEPRVVGNGRPGMYSEFELKDESPAPNRFNGINIQGNGMGSRAGTSQWTLGGGDDENQQVPASKKSGNVRRDLISNFDLSDSSPVSSKQGDRFGGINIQGNGMGSRAGTSQWRIGADSEDEQPVRAQAVATARRNNETNSRFDLSGDNDSVQNVAGRFSGINIQGNGMGSRAGTSQWKLGADVDDVAEPLVQHKNTGNVRNSNYNSTNAGQAQKPAAERFSGINIQGNGMGSRAGTTQWSWMGEPDENSVPVKATEVRQSQRVAQQQRQNQQEYQPNLASKKQFTSSWSFGGDDDNN